MTTLIVLSVLLVLVITLCVIAARKDWPLPQLFFGTMEDWLW